MSRLLEPITLQRQRDDYLARIDGDDWVSVKPPGNSNTQGPKYQINPHFRQEEAPFKKTVDLELPVGHESENLEVLAILKSHSNRATAESSGPTLRSLNAETGEVVENFPIKVS